MKKLKRKSSGVASVLRRQLRAESMERRLLLAADGLTFDVPHAEPVQAEVASAHQHADAGLRFSASGKAYYFDPADSQQSSRRRRTRQPVETDAAAEASEAKEAESDQKHPLSAIPILHSNPTSPQKFYLDFDGQVVTKTDWNIDNGGKPIHAVPYDIDGDLTTFSDEELDRIHKIWQRVSEDFLPFDVDVTTELPSQEALDGQRQAIRAIITTSTDDAAMGGSGEPWFSASGGVAFIGSWNWNGDTPVWVFYNHLNKTSEKAVAEAVAHELGHAVGLAHDGVVGGSAYYSGHGSGETSWAPIMGAGYDANVTQWNRGVYDGSNNAERDTQTITSRVNQITFREDDHGDFEDDATPLVVDGGRVFGSGIISQRTDIDFFSFEHHGGMVQLDIQPAEIGPNLDIIAEIYDDQGEQLLAFEPDSLAVHIQEDLDAGTYFLLIDGGPFLPSDGSQGYNDYGSLGQYTITGVIGQPGLTADAGGPYQINEGEVLSLDASSIGANEDESPLSYSWDINGDGTFGDVVGRTAELTWDQLTELGIRDDGSYLISVRVADSGGVTATAVTDLRIANLDPLASLTGPTTSKTGEAVVYEIFATDVLEDPVLVEWSISDGTTFEGGNPSVTHIFTKPGVYNVDVTVSDDDGGSNVISLQVNVEEDLPIVQSSSLSEGDVVANLQQLEFQFSDDVSESLNPSDLLLFNNTTSRITNVADPAITWSPETNTATFNTAGLPPGVYSVVLVGDGIYNKLGEKLDGNRNGKPGGNVSFNFTVAAPGDADLDGAVGFADFLRVANNFGQAGGWQAGDFDGDGRVGFSDFLILANNYGV